MFTAVAQRVTLTQRGRGWVGNCPFHRDAWQCFHVAPDRAFFHCFGCNESGRVEDFLRLCARGT